MSDSMPLATSGGHGLMCPTCNVQLLMSDRQGIEIDFCPKCRGVWLDRGELDKIIERSLPSAATQPAEARSPAQDFRSPPQDSHDRRGGHGQSHGGGHGKQDYGRRESFLSRLFD